MPVVPKKQKILNYPKLIAFRTTHPIHTYTHKSMFALNLIKISTFCPFILGGESQP